MVCDTLSQNLLTSPCQVLPLFSKCQTTKEANQLYARLIKNGQILNNSLTTKIILSLTASPNASLVEFARRFFFTHRTFQCEPRSSRLDPFLWNAIIKSYSHGDDPSGGLHVFCLMLENEVPVDKFTISLLLKACSRLGLLKEGMQLHAFLLKQVLNSDLFLLNCIIGLYIRCGCLMLAGRVFERMINRDSVTYNSMIDGYVKLGRVDLARDLFDQMPSQDKDATTWNSLMSGYVKMEGGLPYAWNLFDENPHRDRITWNLMIEGCAKCGNMDDAQNLFELMPKRDAVSWTNIIDGYSKAGHVLQAMRLFESMPEKDVIVCNVMMGGQLQNGYFMEALDVFYRMDTEFTLLPDDISLSIALSAVAQLGRLDKGVAIHCYMLENGFSMEGKIGASLIDMYSKCGCIEKAIVIFERINFLTVDHFNAMIGGFAIHGFGDLAFDLFLEMKRRSIPPDDLTFIGILNACGHAGMLKEGIICFEIMRRIHDLQPKSQHYGCMVSILCRAGNLKMATKFVEQMPVKPNDIIIKTILSALKNHDDAETVPNHLWNFESANPGSYVLLSNRCAVMGMWSEVRRARAAMKERKMMKIPGSSWLDLDGDAHEFLVNDASHPEVYALLDGIYRS